MTADSRNPRLVPPLPEELSLDAWNTLSEEERLELFQSLTPGDASDLYLSLSPGDQEALLSALPVNARRVWLRLLAQDDAADVIQHAPEDDREALLALLDPRTRSEVEALLTYQADVAGGRMSPSYARLRPEMTATQALAYLRLQASNRTSSIFYAYVLDDDGRLLGAVSFRELMAAPAARRVQEFMLPDPVSVHEDTDQEAVAQILQEHGLLAVPVVDDEGRVRGIVTVDDVMDVVQQEATEDIHKIGGVEALDLPYFRTPGLTMLRKRAPWLALLFFGEMLTASAMGVFEAEIEQAVVLALFIPLVISSGGNTGSQATTLVIRAMALGEVHMRDWLHIMRREIAVGLGLGALLATIGVLRIVLWETAFDAYGSAYLPLAFTLGFSLLGVVAWGTLVGSMLPLLLRRAGFDPANASAPFVATLCDVTGLMIYFSVAKVLLLGGV